MIEYKVLITTSGMGSRLGDLTKYTNKSLVRINTKPIISHIIENYPEETKFVITLGHYGDQVRDFLTLAYPNTQVTFVEVDKFEGPDSSLGYSMLKAKDELLCPFIFHACDTLLFEPIPDVSYNWIGGCNSDKSSSQFRTLQVHDDYVAEIYDKGYMEYDSVYIGLCGIKDYKTFWQSLENQYKNNDDTSLCDCHALSEMLDLGYKFNYIDFPTFQDTGNSDSLKLARRRLDNSPRILNKPEESIFFLNGKVVKFFNDPDMVSDRVKRAEILSPLVPKISGSKTNFYSYEFEEGKAISDTIDVNNFKHLLSWANKNLWKTSKKNIKSQCEEFYFDKTIKRVDAYIKKHGEQNSTVNGIKCPDVKDIMKEIDKHWLIDGIASNFHGDFILDNILINDSGKITLIDWRQNFGYNSYELGDMYYDLAKLNHSLIFSHKIIESGGFEVNISGHSIKVDLLRSHILVECQNILHKYILNNNLDMKKILVLTALIWINMAPLHEYPLDNFLFYFGKYNLWRSL